jgi:hypothetical protein
MTTITAIKSFIVQAPTKYAIVFVPDKHFQPTYLFVGTVEALCGALNCALHKG